MKRYFGYEDFRKGQKEIILELMKGNDVLGILPTGTGKSLCYQLPAFLLEGVTVVVSPLISLMIDQVKQLKMKGIKKVTYINSLMNPEERKRVIRHLSHYKMIYCSPEMLQNRYFIERLRELNVSLFVVDEAHCISQWGYEFRTDYLRLKHVLAWLEHPVVLALSATATPEVQKDIMEQLNRPQMLKKIYPMDRENIVLTVEHYRKQNDKLNRIAELLRRFPVPAMIYFSSKKWCEHAAARLQEELSDLSIVYYHGGMDKEDRLYIQQQFMNDQVDVVCCTSAFGMGIDKDNIRLVIHFHIPANVESYIQEAGRAGRDGEASVSLIQYTPSDEDIPLHLISDELPDEKQIESAAMMLSENYGKPIEESFELHMMETLQLNDIQWGFIKYQFECYGLISENRITLKKSDWKAVCPDIWDFMSTRMKQKQRKLNELLSYLEVEECRRKRLYKSFQNDFKEPLYHCCDRCGFTFDQWNPPVRTKVIKKYTWEQKLKEIFHQGE
ncbi:MAG: ATP-dependent DNA helicase RecQ [Bacillaceae bacterium]|nr:ATP-dependent DNA helicase RecQ [Bacillaceae bacterium]